MRRRIDWSNVFVGVLLLWAGATCAGCASTGERTDERVQLCITNESGGPVTVYAAHRRLGTVSTPTGCVALPHDVSNSGDELCVRTVAMSTCEPLPQTNWTAAPVWSLTLRHFVNSWRWDVLSLRPESGGQA